MRPFLQPRTCLPVCALAGALGCALLPFDVRAADDAPPASPWRWDGIYKADLLGSRHAGAAAIGNLGLRVTADAGALFGWDDTTLHAEALWNHGSKPNRRIATVQGVSNLEVAQNAARVYASWIEHEFKSSGTSVLFGLYDLNSEFYATDASGLLIHPSFGIGIDFSQSGRNGPSIFPNLGLALRVKQSFGNGLYVQAAAIDGVPGNPDHPGRTTIHLSQDDGALLVGEFGWQQRGDDGPKPGHWGIGAWHYTQRTERIDGDSRREHNQGAYALAQGLLFDAERARTTGFVRAGIANRRVNAIDVGFDAGVLVEQPFGKDGPAAFTAGVAIARFGQPQRQAQRGAGVDIASRETAFEVGARWQPHPALALQPLLQRVWNAGGRPGAHETIAGLRIEWSFGSPSP
ncbi:MAG TPA: carbohydrate porin [Burkholderiaceae bacterium]|nr:carbohydrate porin [Burkholderiaceae bacterium]